jgi:hypothetical protein
MHKRHLVYCVRVMSVGVVKTTVHRKYPIELMLLITQLSESVRRNVSGEVAFIPLFTFINIGQMFKRLLL